jgi:hypothetical protein
MLKIWLMVVGKKEADILKPPEKEQRQQEAAI